MAIRRHIWNLAAVITILSSPLNNAIAGEPGGEPDPTAKPHSGASDPTVDTDSRYETPRITPRISDRVGPSVTNRINSAFDLALARLEENPECRALFAELDAEGIEMLSTTLYYPAALKLERDLCRRAEGYTTVGGAPTFLCRRFSKLPDRRAAMVLIHEALHHAGLDERPHDPEGPSSREINDMVSEACRL